MDLRSTIRKRLAQETGTLRKDAAHRVAMLYPSPYHVGMSSLGFQTIYRVINDKRGWAAERAFLPDDVAEARRRQDGLLSYEAQRR